MMRNYNDDVVIVCVVEDRCATLTVNSVYSWRTPDNTQPALSTQSSELSSANWIGSFICADAVSPPPVPPANTISFGGNSAACSTLPSNWTEYPPPILKHWHNPDQTSKYGRKKIQVQPVCTCAVKTMDKSDAKRFPIRQILTEVIWRFSAHIKIVKTIPEQLFFQLFYMKIQVRETA